MRTDIGLYIHVPFCLRKCNYCDFASFSPDGDFRSQYIKKLTDEIRSYKGKALSADTVFFGGGTPSLLNEDELKLITDALYESFLIRENAEFTVEVNPATLTEKKLDAFICAGANRFSIGLQSIHENELKILGRIHTYEDFLNTYKLIRSRGINNVSVDLMFGIPEQTKVSFEKTLRTVAALSPEHLSVYGLIVEEGTPFYKAKETLKLHGEDEERELYFSACKILSDHGFEHYEISNFAKPEMRCRHNMKYWKNEEYLGLGLAAHSYLDGVRFGNSRVPNEYFTDIKQEREVISAEDERFLYGMLALRLSDGVNPKEYQKRYGCSFTEGKEEKINTLSDSGFIKTDRNAISLTEKGFWVSNTLITDLLF